MAHRDTFAQRLRTELDRADLSVRALAKRLDADNPETARRNLMRYLSGSTKPGQRMRDAIADALGVDRSLLSADDEEEEEVAAALLGVLRKLVRQLVAEVATS